MLTFSNPRRKATFTDWPLSFSKRGECTFEVHSTVKKGERVSRTTTGKPKFTTYASKAAMVDGSNGKTYLLLYSDTYGAAVRIASSDMQHDATQEETGLQSAYVRLNYGQDELFYGLKALVDSAI